MMSLSVINSRDYTIELGGIRTTGMPPGLRIVKDYTIELGGIRTTRIRVAPATSKIIPLN